VVFRLCLQCDSPAHTNHARLDAYKKSAAAHGDNLGDIPGDAHPGTPRPSRCRRDIFGRRDPLAGWRIRNIPTAPHPIAQDLGIIGAEVIVDVRPATSRA